MTKKATGQEEIKERLRQAIDGLRKDATRVEIWATALGKFAEPIPDYQPDEKFLLGKEDSTKDSERPKAPPAPPKRPR